MSSQHLFHSPLVCSLMSKVECNSAAVEGHSVLLRQPIYELSLYYCARVYEKKGDHQSEGGILLTSFAFVCLCVYLCLCVKYDKHETLSGP